MRAAFSAIAQQLFKIQPEELRRTGLAFTYLFATIGAFIISRITRSVLFMEIPNYQEQLPLTYLGVAVTVSVVMYGYARVERKLRRDVTNKITLIVLIAVMLGFRVALEEPSTALYWAFFIWVEVFGTFLVVQFWSMTNEIFHSRQAKRLFAVIGGGGVLANIAIGFGVKASVKALGTENLLVVICGLLLFCLFMLFLLGHEARAELVAAHERGFAAASTRQKKNEPTRRTGQPALATRHVQFIALVIVLTYLVATVLDYQFNVVVAESIPGRDDRSAFFGTFFGVTGILGGGIQFFATVRILERFGVLTALLLLPCCLLVGSMTLLAVPMLGAASYGLYAASFTKGSENVLRYTVNDSTLQLLYLPVPSQVRGRAKALIDGIFKPLSMGAAGLILAVLMGQIESLTGIPIGIKVSVYSLSWLTAIGLVGWMVFLLALQREYLKSLVRTLQRRRLNFDEAKFQITDESTVKTLEETLSSESVRDVLHAVELLYSVAPKARRSLSPSVLMLLKHAAEDVRVCALQYLRSDTSLEGIVDIGELLSDPSASVRAAAVLAYTAIHREQAIDQVTELLDDEECRVRSAAVAGLVRYGGLDGVLACADQLKRMMTSDSPVEREQAAWVLGEVGVATFYQPLVPLLQDRADIVRQAAIEAAERLQNPELIEPLLEQLERPRVCGAAVNALVSFGNVVEEPLALALRKATTPASTRAQICRVLARLGSNRAADILHEHLLEPHVHVRTAVAQALRAMVNHAPGVPVRHAAIDEALRAEAKHWYELLTLRADLDLEDQQEVLLCDALEHRQTLARGRILALLGAKYPDQPIDLVSTNLSSSQAASRANAVEVLDNVLSPEEKATLIPIFDDAPRDRKVAVGVEAYGLSRATRIPRLQELVDSEDSWLSTCAAVTVGRLRIESMADRIAGLLDADDPNCREAAAVTLQKLRGPEGIRDELLRLCQDPVPRVRAYAEHILAQMEPRPESTP